TDAWDEIVETLQGAPVSTDTELGAHMREFETLVRRDTDEIYTRLDDEQGQRQLLASRVPLGVLHQRTCQRMLVAVLRLDSVMASRFVFSLLSVTGEIPASKA
ncbi:hypothetical protein Tco_0384383, partial [Tanacetum coccineum]